MHLHTTRIPGVLIIERPTHADQRGYFHEVVRLNELAAHGIKFSPVQMNHTKTIPGVLRGLHAENWNKLIYPASGKVFVALADVRPSSPTFGKVETFTFEEDGEALFIPKGVANSYCALGDTPVHYFYLVDAYYDGSDQTAVAWDDPDLNIPWPIKNPTVSDRDKKNPKLRELFPGKFGKY